MSAMFSLSVVKAACCFAVMTPTHVTLKLNALPAEEQRQLALQSLPVVARNQASWLKQLTLTSAALGGLSPNEPVINAVGLSTLTRAYEISASFQIGGALSPYPFATSKAPYKNLFQGDLQTRNAKGTHDLWAYIDYRFYTFFDVGALLTSVQAHILPNATASIAVPAAAGTRSANLEVSTEIVRSYAPPDCDDPTCVIHLDSGLLNWINLGKTVGPQDPSASGTSYL
jgi:hypothetical protein